jgi:hypothetical protein
MATTPAATDIGALRASIFNSDDIKREPLKIPEWGGIEVEVRGITGEDRIAIAESSVDENGQSLLIRSYPELVIASVYAPGTDQRVFSAGDRELLMKRSSSALERLASVALRLSGLTGEAAEKAGKDSAPTPTSS